MNKKDNNITPIDLPKTKEELNSIEPEKTLETKNDQNKKDKKRIKCIIRIIIIIIIILLLLIGCCASRKHRWWLNIDINKEDLFRIVNNLREWFSKEKNDRKFDTKTREDIIISNLSKEKLFDGNFVNDIELEHIKEAINFLNNSVIPNLDKFIQKVKKEESKDDVGEGLDLDEIHNMNIMNNIIKSLDNIIYNQNRIIELLSKQSFSNNLSKQNISENPPQSKQSFSERKLGRFKVEKYKPNMSITEFKKLFDSKP